MVDIEEKVASLIVKIIGVERESITPAARFQQDLAADSLDSSELIMAVEDAFKIKIPTENADKMFRVGDLIAYIGEARSS